MKELKAFGKTIPVKEIEKIKSSYKIRSYKSKLNEMKQKNVPQKPIEEVLEHFFSEENKVLKQKTKESISKIIYCQNARIIIAITSQGKEIIWRRQQLVNQYGWFFFITEQEEDFERDDSTPQKKPKKKKKGHEKEVEISEEEYQFNDITITLSEKKNMRPLYRTKEYFYYLNIMKKDNVEQKPIKEVLHDFFFKNNKIPTKEKRAIRKIIYYQKPRVIVVKSLIGDQMYENLKKIVKKYGWYFYITGVPVGESEISIAIDKIQRRFTQIDLQEIGLMRDNEDPQEIKLSLYPVVLKPNHNSIILNIGDVNILLDCGFKEKHIEHIKFYLENLEELRENMRESRIIREKPPSKEERLKEIKELRKFESEARENGDGRSEAHENNDEEQNTIENPEKEDEIREKGKEFKPKIDMIFVSHSHFDHVSGLKELIQEYPDTPIICSRITLDLFLLRDSNFLKQESHEEIEEQEYRKIVENVVYVENGDKIEFKNKDCYIAFFHAGHMPGALMLLAKIKDFRFLFTGDYTYWDYTPFAGTGRFLEQISRPIDFLLIDATSAYEVFDNPSQQFHSLILFLEQKAEYGDTSLIGADPSSLAISFMLTFWRYFRKLQLKKDYKKRPNIYVDMMVRKNIQVINHRYEYIYGPISRLIRDKANPFNSIKFRWFDYDDVDFLKKKNNIIISHPPDLSYGIIRRIVSSVGRHPHNLVYLSGAIHEEPAESLVYPPDDEEEAETEENNDKKAEDKNEIEEREKADKVEGEEEDQDYEVDDDNDEEEEEDYFEPRVIRTDKKSPPLIQFKEKWIVPFRAMLLNKFAPDLKIKLHGDKTQLFKMLEVLEPKEVCFFHQSPARLVEVAQEVREMGIEKVSVPPKRRLIELN